MADYLDHLSGGLAVLHDLLPSEEGQHAVELTASLTGASVQTTQLVQELSEALESRTVIDQAKGMLMTRLACDATEAFDLLMTVSKDSNEKMVVIAKRMVDSVIRAREI